MTDPVVQAYAERIPSFNQKQIKLTVANHERLVGTERWSALDAQTRDRLTQMYELLKSALK